MQSRESGGLRCAPRRVRNHSKLCFAHLTALRMLNSYGLCLTKPMQNAVLVLNAGSSSLKFALFQADAQTALLRGQIANIGQQAVWQATSQDGVKQGHALEQVHDHQQAIAYALQWINTHSSQVQLMGVGHRVVHGGAKRCAPALVTPELLIELDALSPLAPQHQPHNLAAMRAVAEVVPELPQVACFDTAFHATQDPLARLLPLPQPLRGQGLQRYGFHGLSYEYIASALPVHNNGQLPQRLLVAHLGNGASLCAIRDGQSIATSMGFSTLDGLLMGSRSGSIDPGVLLYLLDDGMTPKELSDLLYKQSGLLGVSGISADMQVLLKSDRMEAKNAVDLFCYTLVRCIGSMAAALGGVDGMVFTGGIGEHAAPIRQQVCGQLAWLGLDFDAPANADGETLISTANSQLKAWVIPTNEELVIARQTYAQVSNHL
jgi:acetate kinase